MDEAQKGSRHKKYDIYHDIDLLLTKIQKYNFNSHIPHVGTKFWSNRIDMARIREKNRQRKGLLHCVSSLYE